MHIITIYRRVLGLLAAEKRAAIILGLANLLLAALHFAEPVLFGRVIEAVAAAGGAGAPALLLLWGVVGLGTIGATAIIALKADRLAHRCRLETIARTFEKLLSLPRAFHADAHTGQLHKVMFQGADNLFTIWLMFFREHLATIASLAVILPLTLFLNWRLGSLLIVVSIVHAALIIHAISRTERAQQEVEAYHSRLAEQANDAIRNVTVIQSFVRLGLEVRRMREVIRSLIDAQFPVLNRWALVTVLARASATIAILSIFATGVLLNADDKASISDIVSFTGFAMLLVGRLEQMAYFCNQLVLQAPVLAELFAILDTQPNVKERANAASLTTVKGEVRFEGVSFSYDGVRPAVRDLTFHVRAGSKVAFVGRTGAGKTTAISLLYRLYDPQAGRILLDGRDIAAVTLDSLRANIAVVFQDTTLFHRSIEENLRIGRPAGSRDDMIEAARIARAHDFIIKQPRQYDTVIGEFGRTLSGGELQRIGVARALLKDAPVLVLDEATSALDSETEMALRQGLEALLKERTVFIISHRLSTLQSADTIFVMDDGRIVEAGAYDELLARNGAFTELMRGQLLPS